MPRTAEAKIYVSSSPGFEALGIIGCVDSGAHGADVDARDRLVNKCVKRIGIHRCVIVEQPRELRSIIHRSADPNIATTGKSKILSRLDHYHPWESVTQASTGVVCRPVIDHNHAKVVVVQILKGGKARARVAPAVPVQQNRVNFRSQIASLAASNCTYWAG